MDSRKVLVYTLASSDGGVAIAPKKTMFDGDDRFDNIMSEPKLNEVNIRIAPDIVGGANTPILINQETVKMMDFQSR
ncbi:MAG: hypothetical protein KGY80_08450 [Candidatus Thorarchaeota archaeon]|nr:hypothetical protein [Candidatus Thorarchaeota archaeon]